MSGIWFEPQILADSLSETVGYKAGLALSVEQICEHVAEDADLVRASEERTVRLRPEEYEQLFYRLLHRVGYTAEEYDGDYLGIRLFHKYKDVARKEYEGVLELSTKWLPRLIETTEQAGKKTIDPTPFILECAEKFGPVGVKIAIEQIEAINRGIHLSPHTGIRYREWKESAQLTALFSGEAQIPEGSAFFDQRYIDYLSANNEKLPAIHWRKFEELTAEYFARQGFQVDLGPGRDDDGVDIRVWRPGTASTESPLCLVQCKRQKDKVEKVVVKGLHADVQFEGADFGVIVTTSELSPGARATVSARGYPIEEINRESLSSWLAQLRTPGTGIVRV